MNEEIIFQSYEDKIIRVGGGLFSWRCRGKFWSQDNCEEKGFKYDKSEPNELWRVETGKG